MVEKIENRYCDVCGRKMATHTEPVMVKTHNHMYECVVVQFPDKEYTDVCQTCMKQVQYTLEISIGSAITERVAKGGKLEKNIQV